MIATIAKRFTFDAAHHLPTVPADHKCHRMHGHTYEVEFVLRGPIGDNGFVLDYADIAAAWAPIFATIDHRTLNDIPGLEVPSTEVLVGWLFRELSVFAAHPLDRGYPFWDLLLSITVKESSTTWCQMRKSEWLLT
jgi:6-pyruvoyltetrahydropterin/6-carboxytetrahydropterin synthase